MIDGRDRSWGATKRESLLGAEKQKDGAWSPSRAERKEAAKGGMVQNVVPGSWVQGEGRNISQDEVNPT